MICPRCNTNIQDGTAYCTQCGYTLHKRKRLIGNSIYAIYSFCLAVQYCMSALTFPFMFTEHFLYNIVGFTSSFIFAVIYLFTGLLLWKRKTAGLILAILNNIFCILLSVPINIGGLYFSYIGLSGQGEYDALNLIFGIPLLILGGYLLLMGLIFLIYYIINRKYFLFKKNDTN